MANQQMLIGKSFAFIHVPKTGGVSIRQALRRHGRRNNFYPHISAACLQRQLGRRQFGRLFSFAVVRHPLSWLVSVFHHMRKAESDAIALRWRISNWHYVLDQPILTLNLDRQPIDSYLDRILNTLRVTREGNFSEFIEEGAAGRLDVIPQSQWVVDPQGEIIVDFIGKFELLQDHLRQACVRMGLDELELPHMNKGKYSDDWRDYYNDRLERLSIEWMGDDFEKFDYEPHR